MTTTDRAGWVPDGHGLTELSRELVDAGHGGAVHLRLTQNDGSYPKAACGGGIGDWWSGLAAEVTCPACLELVHA